VVLESVEYQDLAQIHHCRRKSNRSAYQDSRHRKNRIATALSANTEGTKVARKNTSMNVIGSKTKLLDLPTQFQKRSTAYHFTSSGINRNLKMNEVLHLDKDFTSPKHINKQAV
jgi:hypothetical protein